MRFERDASGDFVLDAADMAALFRVPVALFRHQMQLGLVSSMVETGEGEDAGTCRLTLRCGSRQWRAVLDADGQVMQAEMSTVRPPMPRQTGRPPCA